MVFFPHETLGITCNIHLKAQSALCPQSHPKIPKGTVCRSARCPVGAPLMCGFDLITSGPFGLESRTLWRGQQRQPSYLLQGGGVQPPVGGWPGTRRRRPGVPWPPHARCPGRKVRRARPRGGPKANSRRPSKGLCRCKVGQVQESRF